MGMGMGSLREVDGVESERRVCVVTIAHLRRRRVEGRWGAMELARPAAAWRLDGLQSTSTGRRLRACRAIPASQASSRSTPAPVAVPSSTGHEMGTLTVRG